MKKFTYVVNKKALPRKKITAFKKEKIAPIELWGEEFYEVEIMDEKMPKGIAIDTEEVKLLKIMADNSTFIVDNNYIETHLQILPSK